MRAIDPGHVLFALGMAGLGILSLVSGHFAFIWQPVPDLVAWREPLARLTGAFLLVFGLGMLTRRTAAGSTLLMTVYLSSWVLVQEAPRAAHSPAEVGVWLGVAESVMMACGCWMIHASIVERERAEETVPSGIRPFAERGKRVARLLIGVSCMVLGLSHFVYTGITASMVPAWLPGHVFFAYLTGIGHFAAGLGILFSIVPRLAAALEASMLCSFALLVQLPGIFSVTPGGQQWMKLLVTTALAGAVWTVAYSLRGTKWSSAKCRPIEVDPLSP